MSPELKATIEKLIELDTQRHVELMQEREGKPGHGFQMGQLKPSLVRLELEKLSRDDLAYVLALMWYGRGDDLEDGATFESTLAHAKLRLQPFDDQYISEKPLRIYLQDGLDRLAGLITQ